MDFKFAPTLLNFHELLKHFEMHKSHLFVLHNFSLSGWVLANLCFKRQRNNTESEKSDGSLPQTTPTAGLGQAKPKRKKLNTGLPRSGRDSATAASTGCPQLCTSRKLALGAQPGLSPGNPDVRCQCSTQQLHACPYPTGLMLILSITTTVNVCSNTSVCFSSEKSYLSRKEFIMAQSWGSSSSSGRSTGLASGQATALQRWIGQGAEGLGLTEAFPTTLLQEPPSKGSDQEPRTSHQGLPLTTLFLFLRGGGIPQVPVKAWATGRSWEPNTGLPGGGQKLNCSPRITK